MTEKHLWISRIVDRDDSPEDWASLDSLAERDRNAWQDLLQSLRDDALVRQAVTGQLAVADTVTLPATRSRNGVAMGSVAFALSGWLAAAALVLMWWGGCFATPVDPQMSRVGEQQQSAAGRMQLTTNGQGESVDPGVLARVEPNVSTAGSPVAELPSLLVEARQVPGTSKTEVLYVRRTLERAVVSDAYRMAVDDAGRPVAVPTDLKRYMPTRVY